MAKGKGVSHQARYIIEFKDGDQGWKRSFACSDFFLEKAEADQQVALCNAKGNGLTYRVRSK